MIIVESMRTTGLTAIGVYLSLRLSFFFEKDGIRNFFFFFSFVGDPMPGVASFVGELYRKQLFVNGMLLSIYRKIECLVADGHRAGSISVQS